ncbi:MAG TPA: phosphomannomutase/phosphoglucomutase, partial [Spongiibacteraceae bacterium]|nr:phosphomannomutase/phosphoglucomutase [Spongiibacteraceae bacterium]
MAKSSTKTPPAAANARSAQNALMRIIVRGAAVGLIAVIISFAYLIVYDLPTQNRVQQQRLSNELAAQQAQAINELTQQLQARLAAAARSAALLERLNTQDADLGALQTELQHSFPEALSLRLIPLGSLGIAGVDNTQAGLRNNIEVDMLRRVSEGAASQPEAYQVDKQWLVSFVQPVAAANSKFAAGAILVTIPATYIEKLLARGVGQRGNAALIQKVGSQTLAVASAGSGDVQEYQQAAMLAVPQWQLQITPAAAWLESARQSSLTLLLLLSFSAVAILLGLLLCAKDFRRALERNLLALVGNEAVDLPGFAELRQQLQRKLTAAPKPKVEATPEPEVAAAPPIETPETPLHVVEELDQLPTQMPDTIFRAYDIRGIAAHQLTDDIVHQIGLAIGSEAVERGQQEIIVARDGRASSEAIADALIRGLRDSGRNVIDIGLVPTPILYFATHQLGTQSGVMITGSHNGAEYNGLKIVIGGKTLSGQAIAALKSRIQERRYSRGKGNYRTEQIDDRYIDYILNDVAIAQPLKIVIDAGNGVTGIIAPRLFQELGCEVIPLYCDIDPNFPNHQPDPSIAANLAGLVKVVLEKGADVGIAFDGDGDRVGVVTSSGAIVSADRLLMLLAQDVVSRNPGADVLFDVKCSRSLNNVISSYGGRPIMWKSGHSFMKEKMAETGALLGGEFSGHIFFNERWFGFDDGMYAGARLIEILSTTDPNLDEQLAALPNSISTPEIKIEVDEREKFEII